MFCVTRTAFKPAVCAEGMPASPGKQAPGIRSCYSTALHRRATESTKWIPSCSEQSRAAERATRVPLRPLRVICQAASGTHQKGMLYSREVIIYDAGQFLGTLNKNMHAQLMNHSESPPLFLPQCGLPPLLTAVVSLTSSPLPWASLAQGLSLRK